MAEPGELSGSSGLEEDVNLWFVFVYRAESLVNLLLLFLRLQPVF